MAGRKGQSEQAAARRVEALNLRMAGASYRQIGARLGISEAQAHKDVARELDRLAAEAQEAAQQVLALELARLDMAQLAIAQQVRNGNLGAIDRWLRIGERRARLLGLDAPTRQEIKGTIGPVQITAPALEQAARELNEWRKEQMSALSSWQSSPPTLHTPAPTTE